MLEKVYVPPVKIQGIKTKIVPLIAEAAWVDEDTIWMEPFMGSGVVGLNLAPKHAIFADTNPHTIALYNAIKSKEINSQIVREFLEREGKILEEKDDEHYYYIRDRFNEEHNPLDFLFLNRSCFNGMIRFNRNYKFNVPYGHKPKRFAKAYVTKIVNQVKRLESIFPEKDWEFKCQSFETTIREAPSNAFIYCDPPYIGRHVDYYDSWDEEHEIHLKDSLVASNAKFMLSTWEKNKYRENVYIDTVWNGCYKVNQGHFYYIGAKESNRNSMLEALLMNYDPNTVPGKTEKKERVSQLSFLDIAENIKKTNTTEENIMGMDFIKVFNRKLSEKDINWEVSALASPDGKLFSLGSDSKLIGRIFELITYNILQEIADENGMILHSSEAQTVYPDFTLMRSESDTEKLAVDIKTTYRKFKKDGNPSGYVFTLGSFASYMRDGRKNISYPYSEYARHYVIGFVYTRNDNATEGQIFKQNELSLLQVPYKDVEVFVQEKYKIAGDKPGSGNTENIGSFKTNNMSYLINGEGPFSDLGLDLYEDYWAGYKKYRGVDTYTSLDGYFDVQGKKGSDVEELRRTYDYWRRTHKN